MWKASSTDIAPSRRVSYFGGCSVMAESIRHMPHQRVIMNWGRFIDGNDELGIMG